MPANCTNDELEVVEGIFNKMGQTGELEVGSRLGKIT